MFSFKESHDQDHGYKVRMKLLQREKGLIKIECDPPGKKVSQFQCNVLSPEAVWELLQFVGALLKGSSDPSVGQAAAQSWVTSRSADDAVSLLICLTGSTMEAIHLLCPSHVLQARAPPSPGTTRAPTCTRLQHTAAAGCLKKPHHQSDGT